MQEWLEEGGTASLLNALEDFAPAGASAELALGLLTVARPHRASLDGAYERLLDRTRVHLELARPADFVSLLKGLE